MQTTTEATAVRKFKGPIGRHRIYLFDAVTREELGSFGWLGTSEAAIEDGVRVFGTAFEVDVVDLATRVRRELTAADFPGRVVVAKHWHPDYAKSEIEYRVLVTREDGFKRNGDGAERGGRRNWTKGDTLALAERRASRAA